MEVSAQAPAIHFREKSLWARLASKCALDRFGMWISTLCAIHCAFLPVLLTVAGLGFLGDERLEWTIIGLSFAIASIRLFHSYVQEHRRPDSVVLFLLGASAVLFAKAEFLDWQHAEPLFMTLGGLLIAGAHWRNHRLVHSTPGHTH